ncbi:MAG: putative ABC exporter domain-containing protein [[Clostridium] innocuum]
MSVLYKLYLTRMKANIRHVFSRKGSAIFAILMILLYGGLIVMSLSKPEIALSMQNITDANMAIMIGVGFTALMVGVMLLQKRKALFMESDAFYLFSGPFTRVQTMRFLMLQNIASAFLCGAVSLLMVILLGSTIELSFPFLLMAFLCFSLVYFVFLVVYYYVYLLSIQKDSYRHIPAIAALLYVLMVAAVYGMVVMQNDLALAGSGTLFLNTELFYWVPLFGWINDTGFLYRFLMGTYAAWNRLTSDFLYGSLSAAMRL